MEHPPYEPNTFQHWHELSVRFRDLDPLRHVNNAIFNTYFEEARIHFLHGIEALGKELGKTRSLVLVHLNIDYTDQITYPSDMTIGSRIAKIGNSSITTFQACYETKSRQMKAVSESVLVWYDMTNKKPSRLPDFSNELPVLPNSNN